MFSITAQAGEKTSEILAEDNAASSCPCQVCHSHCPRHRERAISHPFPSTTTLKLQIKSHHLMITSPYVILGFFAIRLLKNMCFHFFYYY